MKKIDGKFAERLRKLEMEYYELYMETPPISTSTMERMNSLAAGTRKPTIDELVAISEDYDVSINYLLTGDELFPSLHQLKKREAEKVMELIEELKPEIEF